MDLTLQLLGAVGVFLTIGVFVAAFRFALRANAGAHEVAIPRAAIHGGDRRWVAGHVRVRAAHQVIWLQAVFVALGITGIFLMAVCMVGIIGVVLFG